MYHQRMPEGRIGFAKLLEIRICNMLTHSFTGAMLDPLTLRKMRDTVRTEVVGLFSKSKHNLTPTALEWLSNQLFRSLAVDGTSIDDLIIVNEHRLEDLPLSDITLLRELFNKTSLSEELEKEHARRIST